MSKVLQIAIVFLLIWIPLYIFYWRVFRPLALTRVRYTIFECRDRLRILAVNKQLGDEPAVFHFLESRCNRWINQLEDVHFFHLVRARNDKQAILESKRELDIVDNAPKEVRAVAADMFNAVFGAIMLNSPFIGAIGLVAVLAMVVLYPIAWRVRKFTGTLKELTWGAPSVAGAPASC